MLADEVDHVIGVDTHRDQHTLAVVSAPTGAVLAQTTVRTDAHGYRQALRFAGRHGNGVRIWAIEGAGHYFTAEVRSMKANAFFIAESNEFDMKRKRYVILY